MVKYLNLASKNSRYNDIDILKAKMVCKITGSVLPIKKGENESVIKFAASIAGNKDNHEYELFLPAGYRKEIIKSKATEAKITKAEWLPPNMARLQISFGKGYVIFVPEAAAVELAYVLLSKKKDDRNFGDDVLVRLTVVKALRDMFVKVVVNPIISKADPLANTDINIFIQN